MKYKILEILNSSGEYVSGEKISEKLGISRSGVWKAVGMLKKEGYEIESVPSKGYKMKFMPDIINPENIKKYVPGRLYYYPKTESTNLSAKNTKNVPDRSVFIADTQTAGRGRLGRDWLSPKGVGIFMSFYVEPKIPIWEISRLTLIAGLCVCRVVHASGIKWPNDIIMSGKKVAGILTEMTAEMESAEKVVVGIGINVNNEVFNIDLIEKATSMYRETGRKFSREKIICDIISEFFKMYDEFIEGGFEQFRAEYAWKCVTLGREVIIIKNGEEITAQAVDIDENGELIIETDGKRETVYSGEVSVRGLLGYN